jgi:hypothetical protein
MRIRFSRLGFVSSFAFSFTSRPVYRMVDQLLGSISSHRKLPTRKIEKYKTLAVGAYLPRVGV